MDAAEVERWLQDTGLPKLLKNSTQREKKGTQPLSEVFAAYTAACQFAGVLPNRFLHDASCYQEEISYFLQEVEKSPSLKPAKYFNASRVRLVINAATSGVMMQRNEQIRVFLSDLSGNQDLDFDHYLQYLTSTVSLLWERLERTSARRLGKDLTHLVASYCALGSGIPLPVMFTSGTSNSAGSNSAMLLLLEELASPVLFLNYSLLRGFNDHSKTECFVFECTWQDEKAWPGWKRLAPVRRYKWSEGTEPLRRKGPAHHRPTYRKTLPPSTCVLQETLGTLDVKLHLRRAPYGGQAQDVHLFEAYTRIDHEIVTDPMPVSPCHAHTDSFTGYLALGQYAPSSVLDFGANVLEALKAARSQ